MQALRWALFRLRQERCAARMELALKYWGARAARCHSWGCGRNSPLLFAAWQRGRTRSLGQMCWDRCCRIRWILRGDCCLHRVELRYSYIGEIQPYRVVFLQLAIHLYHHIQRRFYIAPSGLLVAAHCHLAAYWKD